MENLKEMRDLDSARLKRREEELENTRRTLDTIEVKLHHLQKMIAKHCSGVECIGPVKETCSERDRKQSLTLVRSTVAERKLDLTLEKNMETDFQKVKDRVASLERYIMPERKREMEDMKVRETGLNTQEIERLREMERLQEDQSEQQLKIELEELKARMQAKRKEKILAHKKEKIFLQYELQKFREEKRWIEMEDIMREMERKMTEEREKALRKVEKGWKRILKKQEEWHQRYMDILRESREKTMTEIEEMQGTESHVSEEREKEKSEDEETQSEMLDSVCSGARRNHEKLSQEGLKTQRKEKNRPECEKLEWRNVKTRRENESNREQFESMKKEMEEFKELEDETEMLNIREKAGRKKEGTDGEQREEKLGEGELLLVSEKQREDEKESERRETQLEVQRIREARKNHMEREKQRKRDRMKQMFSQRLTFTPKQKGQQSGAGHINNASFIYGVQQDSHDQEQTNPEEQEKPLGCPVSPVGETLVIPDEPIHPSPEEQRDVPPPSVAVLANTSKEHRVENESTTVPADAVAKPQRSIGPEGQNMEAQPKAGKGDCPKSKSKSRRLIGWINKKVKEANHKAIQESIRMEEENGQQPIYIRSAVWNGGEVATVAQVEQKKRKRLLQQEQERQVWEARWRKWEEKRTEKKVKKKAKEVEQERNIAERMRSAVGFHISKKGAEKQRPSTAVGTEKVGVAKALQFWKGSGRSQTPQIPVGGGRSQTPVVVVGGGRSQTPAVPVGSGRSQSPPLPDRLRGAKVCWT